jgi:hypothetical protein
MNYKKKLLNIENRLNNYDKQVVSNDVYDVMCDVMNIVEINDLRTNILIRDSHDTNFGHNNLIYIDTTNKKFPHNDVQIGGGEKYDEIKNRIKNGSIIPVSNQKQFFQLDRYHFGTIHNFNPNEPLLCKSLFAGSKDMKVKNYYSFAEKYYPTQIKSILAFKYVFPNGNIRLYFDHYLLNEFEKMSDQQFKTIVTSSIYISNHEYDETHKKKLDVFFNKYMEIINQWKDVKFKNGLHRFLAYYDLAASFSYIDGRIKLNNNSREWFVYNFKECFTEFNDGLRSHITGGTIGQHVRHISLNQIDYTYKNTLIQRPKHIVFRDGHATSPGKYDTEFIKELNKVCKEKNLVQFLLPTSVFYKRDWHDDNQCANYWYRISVAAGIQQYCNFTPEARFIPDDVYVSGIGLPFIIQKINNIYILPLKNERNNIMKKQVDYSYGIDEYVLTSVFYDDFMLKNSIYYRMYWASTYGKNKIIYDEKSAEMGNPIVLCNAIMLYYLFVHGVDPNDILTEISYKDLVQNIENLRYDNHYNSIKFKTFALNLNISENDLKNKFRFLLNIIPNKYHVVETAFINIEDISIFNHKIDDILNNGIHIYNNTTFSGRNIPKWKTFYTDLLKKQMGNILNCNISFINNPYTWCVNRYLYNNKINSNCNWKIYGSGIYGENSVSFPYINTPQDIENVLEFKKKIPHDTDLALVATLQSIL